MVDTECLERWKTEKNCLLIWRTHSIARTPPACHVEFSVFDAMAKKQLTKARKRIAELELVLQITSRRLEMYKQINAATQTSEPITLNQRVKCQHFSHNFDI